MSEVLASRQPASAHPRAGAGRWPVRMLYPIFVLSGAAGLFYESVWTRYLGLFVGHDVYAQILVLVIFLGGMALGAAAVGRRSSRIADPLLGYAVVELAVGLIGLVFHDVYLAVTRIAYDIFLPAVSGSSLLIPVKWTIAGALILPQSILLGATFPLMTAGVLRRVTRSPGRVVSLLYFANSLGAAAGVLVAGFYLLAAVGLPGTLIAAAMLNLLIGLLTFALARRYPAASGPKALAAAGSTQPRNPGPQLQRLLLGVTFGTAVASFLYEIGWIRMLSLVLGSATHSFELMLSAFILGLALGALWIGSRADRLRAPLRTLGMVQWAMGTAALATLPLYGESFRWVGALMRTFAPSDAGYVGFTAARYLICLAVMLPATFCAGMTLPLITRTLLAGGWGERAIGSVYALSTLGSIIGAAIAGLLLMPLIGLKGILLAGAATDMALGLWILATERRSGTGIPRLAWAATGAMAAALLVAATLVRFDPRVLGSGVYRTGGVPAADASEMLFYRDGRTATVTVSRSLPARSVSLSTNGKPDASLPPVWFERCGPETQRVPLFGDAATQALAPLITLAHAPQARAAAVIGHGSGMSSHFLLGSSAIEQVTTIEIEPAMIMGSRVFSPANRRVFEDPRSRLVVDDAKSYFAASGQRFDLIFSEPSNPWVSGVSGLFTSEFYARAAAHLTPEGVFGQWLHLYEIDDALVLSVLAAMHQNFASYEMFLTSAGDALIVASNRARLPAPDWSVFSSPLVSHDLCHFLPLTPAALEALRLIGRTALAPLLDGAGTGNSDFYPVLDLGAEKSRYLRRSAVGFGGLHAGSFDLSAPYSGRRVLPVDGTVAPVADLSRLRALALGASLRKKQGSPSDTAGTVAEMGYRRWEWSASLGGELPAEYWRPWLERTLAAERVAHGGTSGVVDQGFYDRVFEFLHRHRAPNQVWDAVTFWYGLRAWDFAATAAAAQRLLPAVEARHSPLDPDEFRDGAVVANLRTGDIAGARAAFDRLGRVARRRPDDLRVRLLDAYIRVAEGPPAAGVAALQR